MAAPLGAPEGVVTPPAAPLERAFQFERDTFTFVNELVWEYRVDPATGRTTVHKNEPPPAYYHRCFVIARSARQFFYHARFDPGRAVADAAAYGALIRAVVARSPRALGAEADRLVLPGYASLRAFSEGQTPLLKAHLGGAWQSYFVRSHWRMVFPVSPAHQERMAARLLEALHRRPGPIAHLFRFPRIAINHALLLFGATQTREGIRFEAYDPNLAARPVPLLYDRARRAFVFPATHYWAGGRVSVVEAYAAWPY
jgi:hypothetical protein